ncbi:hypothetical protein HDU97_005227 [Phlyctochytrium planicorne]|nr:hypothetical protein HDU97_005227 [Phlyctochytrium planicorne]
MDQPRSKPSMQNQQRKKLAQPQSTSQRHPIEEPTQDQQPPARPKQGKLYDPSNPPPKSSTSTPVGSASPSRSSSASAATPRLLNNPKAAKMDGEGLDFIDTDAAASSGKKRADERVTKSRPKVSLNAFGGGSPTINESSTNHEMFGIEQPNDKEKGGRGIIAVSGIKHSNARGRAGIPAQIEPVLKKVGKGSLNGTTSSEAPKSVQAPVPDLDLSTLDLTQQQDVKTLYKTICQLEEFLKASAEISKVDDSDVNERLRMAKYCQAFIVAHPSVAQKYDIESKMWKAFHSRIERIRRSGIASLSDEDKELVDKLISDGLKIYRTMINGIVAKGKERSPSSPMWAKSAGYMGDLARYRAMVLDSSKQKDWSEALQLYTFASFLSPDIGLYYYQLATIHAFDYDFLAAFFEYARCMNVKAPFVNAKDTILLLFASATKPLEGKSKKPRLEFSFLRVYQILYTKISVDTFPMHLKTLKDSLLGRTRIQRPRRWHIHVTIMTLSLLSSLLPKPHSDSPTESSPVADDDDAFFGSASESDKEMRSLAASLAGVVVESVAVDATIERKGGDGVLGNEAIVAPFYSMWQALERFSRILHDSVSDASQSPSPNTEKGAEEESEKVPSVVVSVEAEYSDEPKSQEDLEIPSPDAPVESGSPAESTTADQIVFAEDWMLRGFLPFTEVYAAAVFDGALKTKDGRVEDVRDYFRRKVEYFPGCGVGEERVARGWALLKELGTVFKGLAFIEVDEATGEIVYIGEHRPEPVGRLISLDEEREQKATEAAKKQNGRARRIDDDYDDSDGQDALQDKEPEYEPGQAALRFYTAMPKSVVGSSGDDGEVDDRDDEDEDEEEEVLDFNEMMGGGGNGQGGLTESGTEEVEDEESYDSPEDEHSELLLELKRKREELSNQLQSRVGDAVASSAAGGGGVLWDGNHRRTNSHQQQLKEQISRDRPSSTFKLDRGTSQIIFDTNCFVGDLEHVRAVMESGWSVIVPLVIITELDGLKSAGGHLGENSQTALEFLEGYFGAPRTVGGASKPASNVTLITAQNSVLPWLMVRTEDWGSGVRGVDDVLVRCAKQRKNAVLVSEDVNLRLKARGAGVVTGDMDELCQVILGIKLKRSRRRNNNRRR